MADAQLRAVITAEDRASKVIASVGSSLDTVKTKLQGMQPAFQKMAVVGTAGLGVIGLLGKTALTAAADYEQSTIAFTTMLGSAEKAQSFLKELTDFAKKTPFELAGLQDAAKSLLAYGIEQEKVLPNLKALGDIAAGVGMDKLPNLILAFGQVSAKGRLMGDDLRQFTAAGIPLLAQLGEQFGKSAAEIQEMVTAGEIGFEDVERALTSLTEEGGRFNNLMASQANSFSGMMSNLKDSWNIFMREQGEKILPWAKEVTAALQEILGKVATWISENPRLATTILAVVAGIVALLAVFGTVGIVLPAVIGGITALGAAIAFVAANPIVLLLGALALMIGKLYMAMEAAGGAREFFRQTWDGIKIIFSEAINTIVAAFQPLFNVIERVKSALSSVKSAVSGVTGAVSSGVGKLFGRASGGAVSPTQSYLVGERGAEIFTPQTYGTVMPNNRLAGGGNITVNVYGDVSGQELIDKVKRGIMSEIKLNAQV